MSIALVDASTQVAGRHAHGRLAKVSMCDEWFYKPHERGDGREVREMEFYATTTATTTTASAVETGDGELSESNKAKDEAYASFVSARFAPCPTARDEELDHAGYLRLGNIARGYAKPCVIDVKIGMRTWDHEHDEAYAEKRAKSEAGTTHESLGFKICGAQTYDASGAARKLSREECKAIRMSESKTRQTLEDFVRDPLTGEDNAWFWPALLKKLRSEPLRRLKYRLVGTSLLVVYESGKLAPSSIVGEVCAREARLEARYIDFCHAVRKKDENGVDENFEEGLERFDKFVSTLSRRSKDRDSISSDIESSETTVFAGLFEVIMT